jgi:hypothetical protein
MGPPSLLLPRMLTELILVTLPAASALRLPRRDALCLSRRDAITLLGAGTASTAVGLPASAAAAPPSVRDAIEGLRDGGAKRIYDDKLASARSYVTRGYFTRETSDVEYPSWFAGSWKTTSTLETVLAPAGAELFTPGRNGTEALRRARLEVGQPLQYESRWRPNQGGKEGTYVVDRGFNVAAISAASMGTKAVQNVQENGPDRVELVLKPDAAGRVVYRAELDVVARHTEPNPEPQRAFDCVETVRQTVLLVPGDDYKGPTRPPMVKEVETLCTYERLPNGAIAGLQRTATFLVPDAAYTNGAPLAEQQALLLARGPDGLQTALDVRIYSLLYEKA